MLVPGQTFTHPDGRTLTITTAMDKAQAIGDIFFGTVQFGPMSAGMTITPEGVEQAGFILDEVQPEPTPEPPLLVDPSTPDPATVPSPEAEPEPV